MLLHNNKLTPFTEFIRSWGIIKKNIRVKNMINSIGFGLFMAILMYIFLEAWEIGLKKQIFLSVLAGLSACLMSM